MMLYMMHNIRIGMIELVIQNELVQGGSRYLATLLPTLPDFYHARTKETQGMSTGDR